MFTGIIQGMARLEDFSEGILTLSTDLFLDDCKIGSSICCNGICLTAIDVRKEKEKFFFKVNVSEETKSRSNLGLQISSNSMINLEKSLKIGDEISGHLVFGHVDVVSQITSIKKLANSWEFSFEKKFGNKSFFIVEKGSIVINGISLTIVNFDDFNFTISVIPHTYFNTNLQFAKINEFVNIEFDYLARFLFNKYGKR